MILNLHIDPDRQKAVTYFKKLLDEKAKIELKKIPEKRSISQNSYLHKLFTLWGSEYGLTTEEAKITVKRALGYVYQKGGQEYFTQTSGMDKVELTEFIDKFRTWASHNGCYLPSSDEYGLNYAYYEQQVERAIALEKRYGSV